MSKSCLNCKYCFGEYESCLDYINAGYDDKTAEKCQDYTEKPTEEEDEHEYTSATQGDYGPSCPWNAPGMSISDFI